MAIPDIQKLNVGIHNAIDFNKIKMKQYDKNTRKIEITLVDDGDIVEIPATYVAKFHATKKDKTIIFDDCTVVNNIISYTVDEQLTSVAGDVECEIGLYEPDSSGDTTKDKLIQTATFMIMVTKSVMDRNAIISSNEFNTLTIMINTITGLISTASTSISNANAATVNANNAAQTALNAAGDVTASNSYALQSERWAIGGIESGDDIDNALYYCNQAQNYSEIAAEYSTIIYPNLYIDMTTGELTSIGGENINFSIDTNGYLISEVTV